MAAGDDAFMREVQKKVEKKIRENEISTLEYWKDRLDKLAVMRPEGIAALQLEIRKLSDMMGNRIRTIKTQKE